MPLYDIRCSRSGKTFERMIKLADFEAPIECACGSDASRLISAPLFTVDTVGYSCPVTNKWVGSKREHRENLARQGCRVLEPGEKELNQRRREEAETEFDRKIEATVEKEIESYSSDKRERLYNELVHNDVQVERR
jgi:putative FmdB family regulatory protein